MFCDQLSQNTKNNLLVKHIHKCIEKYCGGRAGDLFCIILNKKVVKTHHNYH